MEKAPGNENTLMLCSPQNQPSLPHRARIYTWESSYLRFAATSRVDFVLIWIVRPPFARTNAATFHRPKIEWGLSGDYNFILRIRKPGSGTKGIQYCRICFRHQRTIAATLASSDVQGESLRNLLEKSRKQNGGDCSIELHSLERVFRHDCGGR